MVQMSVTPSLDPVIDYRHNPKHHTKHPGDETCKCHDDRPTTSCGAYAHEPLDTENSWEVGISHENMIKHLYWEQQVKANWIWVLKKQIYNKQSFKVKCNLNVIYSGECSKCIP